jgi:hypothetical protein
MTHSNVYPLGCDDIFFHDWNKGYVVQSALLNNMETRLFWITTGRGRLDCEMAASMLAV